MHCHLNSEDLAVTPPFQWGLFKHTAKKKNAQSTPHAFTSKMTLKELKERINLFFFFVRRFWMQTQKAFYIDTHINTTLQKHTFQAGITCTLLSQRRRVEATKVPWKKHWRSIQLAGVTCRKKSIRIVFRTHTHTHGEQLIFTVTVRSALVTTPPTVCIFKKSRTSVQSLLSAAKEKNLGEQQIQLYTGTYSSPCPPPFLFLPISSVQPKTLHWLRVEGQATCR